MLFFEGLIYLVIRIVWTFECHVFCWYIYTTDIMNRCSISGNNTEQVIQSQITDLQDNLVVTGTNIGAGPGALNQVTIGTSNTAFGSGTGGAPYGVTTGSGNVMVGAGAGNSCSNGSNNTFLGSNTAFRPGVGYYNGSIALGAGAVITNFNQLMVATNFTAFNMAGLAASTGTSAGTILEFDSEGNILPMAGTNKTVLDIDTAITSINAPNYFWFTSLTLSGTRPPPQPPSTTLSHGVVYCMAALQTWTLLPVCGHARPQAYDSLHLLYSVRTTRGTLSGTSSTMADWSIWFNYPQTVFSGLPQMALSSPPPRLATPSSGNSILLMNHHHQYWLVALVTSGKG